MSVHVYIIFICKMEYYTERNEAYLYRESKVIILNLKKLSMKQCVEYANCITQG